METTTQELLKYLYLLFTKCEIDQKFLPRISFLVRLFRESSRVNDWYDTLYILTMQEVEDYPLEVASKKLPLE